MRSREGMWVPRAPPWSRAWASTWVTRLSSSSAVSSSRQPLQVTLMVIVVSLARKESVAPGRISFSIHYAIRKTICPTRRPRSNVASPGVRVVRNCSPDWLRRWLWGERTRAREARSTKWSASADATFGAAASVLGVCGRRAPGGDDALAGLRYPGVGGADLSPAVPSSNAPDRTTPTTRGPPIRAAERNSTSIAGR